MMNIIFKDIPNGFFKARVSEIKQKYGTYGEYLCFIFTIIDEGELANYKFSGSVKPTPLRQSKFYRWVTNILGQLPEDTISTDSLIGKECRVYISKQNKYYSVSDVSMKD